MKNLIALVIGTIIVVSPLFAQNKADDIVGEWLTQKKDSKILIYKQGKAYFGKILWGESTENKDTKNPDPKLRNQDLIGLVILKNFTFDGKYEWESGTIYDPREGKTYSCIITMNDYNQLHVRGYVGVSLFGRTESWVRVK